MRSPKRGIVLVIAISLLAACSDGDTTDDSQRRSPSRAAPVATTTPKPATTTTQVASTTTVAEHDDGGHEGSADATDLAAANLATAGFQDVAAAEAAGYGSTMDDLGCFESAENGGMGLHYLNGDLMDDQVDIAKPEALVYELDPAGEISGLVAHEYIVPVEAWTSEEPPNLFGLDFHEHPTLPLWVLHAWIWKDNPAGTFADWNPKVRMCPEGVPIFGVDLP